MTLENVKIGKNPPKDVNVVIEIPMNSGPIKYEYDKESEMIFVDRFMSTGMSYPCNYGFIPHTLSGDGDPIDVLVYANLPIISGAVISVRPIGVLITEDEKGSDEKVLAVPSTKIDPYFENVHSIDDLPKIAIERIKHFFENYKALEAGKWVKVSGWESQARAEELILEAIERNNS